jgi:hypothetical protein
MIVLLPTKILMIKSSQILQDKKKAPTTIFRVVDFSAWFD